jgi:5-methyltetrahydrofolate--homocysteine methyltransferase
VSIPKLDKPTVYDGPKGTLLAPRLPEVGKEVSDVTEWLNLLAPEAVRDCYRAYIDAGSEVIQTNTFNGNRLRLEKYGLADKVREVNLAAARIAREAAGDGVAVAGSMGPSGKLLLMEEVTAPEISRAFAEQAAALEEGGVDFLHIETMTDMDEAVAAVEGVRSASSLPVVLTMSFDTGDPDAGLRTMMGVSPTQLVQRANELGLFGVGANCGLGLEGYQPVVGQLADGSPVGALVAKMNAGVPRVESGKAVYYETPDRVGEYARWCADRGARLIGVCCGGGLRSIEAIADALARSR